MKGGEHVSLLSIIPISLADPRDKKVIVDLAGNRV